MSKHFTDGELAAVKSCKFCGHTHKIMASGTRGEEDTLYFCHENDHSCYHDNQGNLFGEGATFDSIIADALSSTLRAVQPPNPDRKS